MSCALRTILTAIFLAVYPARAGILDGPVTNAANGSVYYLLTQNTWTASEAEAVALGGHLATVKNAEESRWLAQTFGEFGGRSLGLWIGLNDVLEENVFRDVNGVPTTFEYWREPFRVDPDGTWDYVHIDWASTEPYLGRWRTSQDVSAYMGLPLHGVVEIKPRTGPVAAIRPAVEITWLSQANRVYQVQWTSALNTNLWTNLGFPIQGTGGTNSTFAPAPADKRFYRVIEAEVFIQ